MSQIFGTCSLLKTWGLTVYLTQIATPVGEHSQLPPSDKPTGFRECSTQGAGECLLTCDLSDLWHTNRWLILGRLLARAKSSKLQEKNSQEKQQTLKVTRASGDNVFVPVWMLLIPLSLCAREEPGYTEEWVPQLVLTVHGQTSGIRGLWKVEQK